MNYTVDTRSEMNKWAIDVSYWDGWNNQGKMIPVKWEDTGFPLALIKSSEGTVMDACFPMQWEAAKCIPRVAYHYFRSDVNAIQQAAKQWSILQNDFTDRDFIAIDFEKLYGGVSGPNAILDLGSFIYEMEKVIDREQIIIYTGASFWYPCGGQSATWASKYKLWQAIWYWDNYFKFKILPPYTWTEAQASLYMGLIETGEVTPPIVKPWTKTDIWQWTSRFDPKQVNGYQANKKQLDHNYIYMELEPPVPPTYCPTCGQIIPS